MIIVAGRGTDGSPGSAGTGKAVDAGGSPGDAARAAVLYQNPHAADHHDDRQDDTDDQSERTMYNMRNLLPWEEAGICGWSDASPHPRAVAVRGGDDSVRRPR